MNPAVRIRRLLQTAALAVLAGYAWLSFSGKLPYSTLLWNEYLLSDTIHALTGLGWSEYATGWVALRGMEWLGWIGGIIFLLAFVAVLVGGRLHWGKYLVFTSVILLLLVAVLHGVDKIFFIVQFAEYTLQWGSLLLWYSAERSQERNLRHIYTWGAAAAAATFAAHGLYALNIFPRPGHFTAMTMQILHVSEGAAATFLSIMGALDLVAALAVLLPWTLARRISLVYMIVWGLLTAIARYAAHVHFQLPWWPRALQEWTPEVLIRFPHFLAPLSLWYLKK